MSAAIDPDFRSSDKITTFDASKHEKNDASTLGYIRSDTDGCMLLHKLW